MYDERPAIVPEYSDATSGDEPSIEAEYWCDTCGPLPRMWYHPADLGLDTSQEWAQTYIPYPFECAGDAARRIREALEHQANDPAGRRSVMTSVQSQTRALPLLQLQDSAIPDCNTSEDLSHVQDEQDVFTSLRLDNCDAMSHPFNAEEGGTDITEPMALAAGTNSLVGSLVGSRVDVSELAVARKDGVDLMQTVPPSEYNSSLAPAFMYSQGSMSQFSEHTSMRTLDLTVNSELMLNSSSSFSNYATEPSADNAFPSSSREIMGGWSQMYSSPPRYPEDAVQRTRSISEDVPLYQDPFSADTVATVDDFFNVHPAEAYIAQGLPQIDLWQAPAMSDFPSEIIGDTIRGTTQYATYSEASPQYGFLAPTWRPSLAGTLGMSELTREDGHVLLPIHPHSDLTASDAWGSSPSPASAWHPEDWQELKFTFPFTGPALPVEIWDMVLDCLVGAEPWELLRLSLVRKHWCTRCRPYLVRNIVFNNRGDVLREHRTRRRDWAGPRYVTIVGTENTRSLSHLSFVAALFGPRWPNVSDVVIEHGDWRTGDFHQDVFHHLHTLLKDIQSVTFHDVTFPSGAILHGLVSQLRFGVVLHNQYLMVALAQVRFEDASMPPTSLSWVRNRHRPGNGDYAVVTYQLDDLDATSLDVIAYWLLAAPDKDHELFVETALSFGNLHDTAPRIIPLLKAVGNRVDRLIVHVDRSLARHLSLPQCPSLLAYDQRIYELDLRIHVQESMSYGWLLRAVSRIPTPEGPRIQYLDLHFNIDVHLSHGNIVHKGPECEGCALHPTLPRSLSGPGVLDDIMASLKTVCDVLDRVLRKSGEFYFWVKIEICCCAQFDPDIWKPRLRPWFPKIRKSYALFSGIYYNRSGKSIDYGPGLGLWCMHCDEPLWTDVDEESS